MPVTPTNLEAVTTFSNSLRNRLTTRPGFSKIKGGDAALAEALSQRVNEALADNDQLEEEYSVTALEAYQWLAAQDIPRDDDRSDAIYDALVEVLKLKSNDIERFNKLHAAALSAIIAQETFFGAVEPLPLPEKKVQKTGKEKKGPRMGVGSQGSAASGGMNNWPSPCHETVEFPAVPPRVILTDSTGVDRYDNMVPETLIDIADRTENFFELLCCLRVLVNKDRTKFVEDHCDNKEPAAARALGNVEIGTALPKYISEARYASGLKAYMAVFSEHSITAPYVAKLEQLFTNNKMISVFRGFVDNNKYKSVNDLMHMPPEFYMQSLRQCNTLMSDNQHKKKQDIFPINNRPHYLRMTRSALGISTETLASALGCDEALVRKIDEVSDHRYSNELFQRICTYYFEEHKKWLESSEERKPFFDRAVLESLPRLSREQIVAQWKKDDSQLFERIENNVAFNTQIANKRGYSSRRKEPGQSVNAETVTAEGPTESPDKLGTRP